MPLLITAAIILLFVPTILMLWLRPRIVHVIAELTNLDDHQASLYLRHRLRGTLEAPVTIDDGRVVGHTESEPLPGPRMITVRPGNAVLLQYQTEYPVIGHGTRTSRVGETVRRVFDLRDEQRTLEIHETLTRDVVPVSITLTVAFAIDVTAAARQGTLQPTAAESDMLRSLTFMRADWEHAIIAAIESCVRQIMAGFTLAEILGPTPRAALEQRILGCANGRSAGWGIRVNRVILQSIQPKQEVTTATTGQWVAPYEGERLRIADNYRSQATREMLSLIAQGYDNARTLGMTDPQIHREVLRRTLEQIAKDPATKVLFTPELTNLLKAT